MTRVTLHSMVSRRETARATRRPPVPLLGSGRASRLGGRRRLTGARHDLVELAGLTASISASMTPGSLSREPTAMPALPFSNSMGFVPWYSDMTR